MKLKTMILVAIFAALTAAGAFIKIPMWPVAITLQTLFSLAAGLLLGPTAGAISQLIYLLLGLLGLPIFTQGGGPGYIFQPSFGFLLALPIAAWLCGVLTRKHKSFGRALFACAASSFLIYLIGAPYMYAIVNLYLGREMTLPAALMAGVVPFLAGDALKCIAAAALAPRLRRYVR